MNTLIITLGNSEIQFRDDRLGDFKIESTDRGNLLTKGDLSFVVRKNIRHGNEMYWVPKSSRTAGQIIQNNYDSFEALLSFPIVEPLIEFIPNHDISEVIFVVTNQDHERYSKGDTLYYAPIIQRYFTQKGLDNIAYRTEQVQKNVKDADKQYAFFSYKLSEWFTNDKEENKYYLFAQGGIDQINHALTLQLLQRFNERVYIYQKAEGEALREVGFPQLFLADLTKQKIIKHLEDYDFGKAASLILNNPAIKQQCEYAAHRLSLNHDEIIATEWQNAWQVKTEIEKKRQKIQDLVYAYRIDFKQGKYNDGLTKLYTVYENLFKQLVDEYTGVETGTFYNNRTRKPFDSNTAWEDFLKEKFGENILDYLRKKKKDIHLNNPNVMTYFYLFRVLIKNGNVDSITDKNVKKLDGIMNRLRQLRNDINHSLANATEADITSKLGRDSLSDLDKLLDSFIDTDCISPYNVLRDNILKNL